VFIRRTTHESICLHRTDQARQRGRTHLFRASKLPEQVLPRIVSYPNNLVTIEFCRHPPTRATTPSRSGEPQ
jgi:hypothetical protein